MARLHSLRAEAQTAPEKLGFARFELPRGLPDTGRFNLAESTGTSLRLRDLLAMAGDALNDLTLDYGDPAGAPALRAVLGANASVRAEVVVTFPGTMLGLYLLASDLCAGGGDALLVTPCFGPTRDALERAGAKIRIAPLRFADGYAVDIDRIAAALRPETRLVCLADPQNPSGVRIPRAAIEALLAAMTCRAPGATLFLDETYREATYGGPPAPSIAPLDPRVVTAGSLSKAHGVPGLRIGWLTIPDQAMRLRILDAKASLIISGSVLDEALAAILLRRAESILPARRLALRQALGAVLEWQRTEAHRVEIVRPDAGALCCLRLAAGINEARFWAALPAEKLRLAPGTWFGESLRVFRLGFGHLPPADLAAALPALSRALDEAA